ncbi:sensor domain-containing protein [Kitasatospora sp. NPDC049285]|uniref:sensor domain-containing protein n=1 Tax=Kitasatospora sp. NPDC049285 TaxID=3157096 RepID=UPI0034250190
MSTASHPVSAPSVSRKPAVESRPGFWRAPFSSFTFREFGYTLTGLPMAILGFTVVVTLFCLGIGTAVTMLGLPVLALLLVAARGLGAGERYRVGSLLGLELPAPRPVTVRREGVWGAITARLGDAAGWKAVLHQFVMFPWAVFSFSVSLVFFTVGWALVLFPAYQWVFARYTDWNGYRVADWTDSHGVHHVYELTSFWQIAAVTVVGLVLVFLTPHLIRGLTNVNRLAARALLAGH